MKKLITFFFVIIVTLFVYIDNAHAQLNNYGSGNVETCTTGIVCRYSFCGMRDSSQAANGLLAQSCPSMTNPNKSVSDCDSFVSWDYNYKNTDGKSCKESEWGNYDYIFKNTDSYLKKTFKSKGSFYCPQIMASLPDSLSDNKYSYGYVKTGNSDYDASNPDSANAWKNMPTGRQLSGSTVTCVDDSTDLTQVRTEAEQSCSGAVVESVEESIEKNKEILGIDEKDFSYIDCTGAVLCCI